MDGSMLFCFKAFGSNSIIIYSCNEYDGIPILTHFIKSIIIFKMEGDWHLNDAKI